MLNMKNCVKRPIYYKHPRHFLQDIFYELEIHLVMIKRVN